MNWQEVRECAIIATLSVMLADSTKTEDVNTITQAAVNYADALIEELKKKK